MEDVASVANALRSREYGLVPRGLRQCFYTKIAPISGVNMTAGSGNGLFVSNDRGIPRIPLSIRFCPTQSNGHHLAVADQAGHLSLFNTLLSNHQMNGAHHSSPSSPKGMELLSVWSAHKNAIFDLAWKPQGDALLSAGGDYTMLLWDVETMKRTNAFRGHRGSVKSVHFKHADPSVFASGARDGNIMIWDTRAPSQMALDVDGGRIQFQVFTFSNAHQSSGTQSVPCSDQPVAGDSRQAVTSVRFMPDDHLLATAGASDGVIKFWDIRNLRGRIRAPVAVVPVNDPSMVSASDAVHRKYGVSSLDLSSDGTRLVAACLDNKVYCFDATRPDGECFMSCTPVRIRSFYVKAKCGLYNDYVASGSYDCLMHVFKIGERSQQRVQLQHHLQLRGHMGDVLDVDWCPSEEGKLASCSDDGRLMCWRIDRCGRRRLSPPSSPRHVFVDNCSNLDRLFTCHVQEDSLLDQEEIAVEEEEPVEDATGGPRQTGIRDFFRPVST